MAPAGSVSFGERLRQLREASGLTQERLAEKAGLSVQGIASLESGRSKRPYPHTLRALGDALELSPEAYALLASAISDRSTRPARASTDPAASPEARLPARITELIGREQDLDALGDILHLGARLLTLTGPGGVGKTSLAVWLASDLSSLYPDGVFFVDLAPLRDAALVIPTIVRTLQLPEAGAGTERDSLLTHLRDKRVLLVLDNFEQVVAASSEVVELVTSSEGLTVLITSRGPLRVRGEREYPVQPLKVPMLDRVPRVEDVANNPAVSLFVDRAQAVVPSFELDRENAAVIAAVCRRLDGLPLAVELAAARVRVLSPMALLSRLDSSLPLLSGGARDLPERQRTMRHAIAWSYELLDEPERALFTRLSVFRGGWTLEAAESVGADEGTSAEDVLSRMTSLVEQSLIVTEPLADGSIRYRYLVPIREFAEERLEERGTAAETQSQHARYFLDLTEQAVAGLTGPHQVEWLSRLELERDNLRSALTWLLDTHGWDAATQIAWNLWVFWWIRTYHAEGSGWMHRVLEEGSRLTPAIRARALGVSGAMALGQGDVATAETSCVESLGLFRAAGDSPSTARNGLVLGLIASGRGDAEKAASYLTEASDVFLGARAHFWAALTVSALGMLPFRQGDYDRADTLLSDGYALARQAGDRFSRYIALYNQSRLAQSRGDHARAAELFGEGLAFSLEVGDRANIAYCLEGLAAVAVARGEAETAAQLLGGANALFEAVGARVYTYRPDQALREQTTAAVKTRLKANVWKTAWAEGEAMSLEDVTALATALADRVMQTPRPEYGLTPREIEILRFLLAHHSDREIADILYISPRTVGTHINTIRKKMGVSTRREAARIAAEHGLG